MRVSNRFAWDIGVYNSNDELVLIVAANTKLNTTANWAIHLRKNLVSSQLISPFPYFLMAFPDKFYLWTPNSLQHQESEPTYIIDARPILTPIYKQVGLSDSNYQITGSSFELMMFSYLRRIINTPHPSDLINSSQDWLIKSGLYSAIAGGNLFHEVIA